MVMLLQSPGTLCWSWVPPGTAGWYETTNSVAAPGLSQASSMELSLIPVTRRFSGGDTGGKGRGAECQGVRGLFFTPVGGCAGLLVGHGHGLGVLCYLWLSEQLQQGEGSGEPVTLRVEPPSWDEPHLSNFCLWCLWGQGQQGGGLSVS